MIVPGARSRAVPVNLSSAIGRNARRLRRCRKYRCAGAG